MIVKNFKLYIYQIYSHFLSLNLINVSDTILLGKKNNKYMNLLNGSALTFPHRNLRHGNQRGAIKMSCPFINTSSCFSFSLKFLSSQ